MASHSVHMITSPIGALNADGFPNTTRSERHDLTYLPCYHESDSGIKSTRIAKYNAKQSESHLSIKSTRIPKYNVKRSMSSGWSIKSRAHNSRWGRSRTPRIKDPPTIVPSPPTIAPSPTAPYPPTAPSPLTESSPPIAPSPHSSVHSNPQHDNEEP
ncbi:uncharacterized protein G2W53_007610 [Senna tora]|uniref:Uncharacterized protein n=1 Tax=Senna tora TaxID=362788 RepID=A0A834X837_9FABA|nr:uncharacterized protein G2W53_007610 [Senna tora]